MQELSSQLVHDWLIIVKGSARIETQPVEVKTDNNKGVKIESDTVDSSQIKTDDSLEIGGAIPASKFYKVTVRGGKQVISRTAVQDTVEEPISENVESNIVLNEIKEKKDDSKSSDKDKSKSRSSSSSKSSSSRSKSSSSSSKDRHKSSSSRSSSSRDKHRRDKDKDRANGSKSSSSNKDRSTDGKEKQAEKDKDTLAKIKPQSIDKLGRIPKKTDDTKTKEVKKPTMSIEVRKNAEERPKTVKVFNSKRRSTGLEEEVKPPPPRPVKKPPVALPASIPQKRASPVRDLPVPPEKKPKIEAPERPGAIKLIPPKPKREFSRYFTDLFVLFFRFVQEKWMRKLCLSSLPTFILITGNGRVRLSLCFILFAV